MVRHRPRLLKAMSPRYEGEAQDGVKIFIGGVDFDSARCMGVYISGWRPLLLKGRRFWATSTSRWQAADRCFRKVACERYQRYA
jgi:hypothetical protein